MRDFKLGAPYVRHPYAFLALLDDEVDPAAREKPTAKSSLPSVRHPYAYASLEDDSEEILLGSISAINKELFAKDESISKAELEKELNSLLKLYKPYVAKPDWAKVTDFVPTFLERASKSPVVARSVMVNLRKFRFSLQPEEQVEFNRAPAERIIGELEKLLK